MLNLINVDIIVIALDLMHVHNFHYRLVNVVKMPSAFVSIIVHQGILKKEKKLPYLLV